MYSQKNILKPEVFFSRIYNLVNTGVFFGKNSHKNAPRLNISLKKKSHDLEIWTRPTCRGILGDGIRKKNIFRPEVTNF